MPVENRLRKAEKVVGQRRFLLCVDEFSRLEEVVARSGSRAVLHFLRDLYEREARWVVMFVGSATREQMAPYWSDYLIDGRFLHISYLQPAEARELIVSPVPGFSEEMRYEEEAVDAILRVTRCQPFLVQLICGELVGRLNGEHRRVAAVEDVEAVVDPALEHGALYLDEIWHDASDPERDVLCAISRHRGVAGEASVLRALAGRELLDLGDGGYRFQVPLIERWFERRARQCEAERDALAGMQRE